MEHGNFFHVTASYSMNTWLKVEITTEHTMSLYIQLAWQTVVLLSKRYVPLANMSLQRLSSVKGIVQHIFGNTLGYFLPESLLRKLISHSNVFTINMKQLADG